MLSLLAALVLGQSPEGYTVRRIKLPEPNNKPSRLQVWIRDGQLDPPKLSPKLFGDPPIRWQFDWITTAFGPDDGAQKDPETGEPMARLRFRIYSQERRAENDKSPMVARQAIRMWDLLQARYRFANNESINHGIVDYYLSWGGKAGGEQLTGEEVLPNNRVVTVNTIYLYDLRNFGSPIEMAREVAHEYGHAALPAVGGFNAPEYWANGYLGEKLFLRWLRDKLAIGHIGTDDTMGSTVKDLDAWIKDNVEAPVLEASSRPPSATMLSDKGPVGMNAYIGLVVYADTILPPSIVGRSMKLMGSQDAKDYPDSLLRAMMEMPKITLSLPPYLKGKPIWIPLGAGKVAQAQVLKRQGDWAQIQPQAGGVVITTSRGASPSKAARFSSPKRSLLKGRSRR